MKRVPAILGSALFLVVAPGSLAGLLPWWISGWRMQAPLLGFSPFRVIGILLMAAGVPVLLDSFVRFALHGRGTPAPIAPPQILVVTGLYRYVRNPMYVAVLAVILGQGLLLGDVSVLEYGCVVWAGFYLFVLGYEEPALRRSFGEEYQTYCAKVRRWIPRLRPWRENPAQ
jgi:protein-S-isoprenylcysteine O-methyltransferase Ste14